MHLRFEKGNILIKETIVKKQLRNNWIKESIGKELLRNNLIK
jgi:hypothetical protein